MRTAIYPGSFDPLHNGHLDVIERASRLCETTVVAVARNPAKDALFSIEERIEFIREATWHVSGVVVTSFEGLLVDFASQHRADAVIRGLRAVSDFEYEFQMALMNREMAESFETIFLMPSQEHIFLSSRTIKEIARLQGRVGRFVPPAIAGALERKLNLSEPAP